jgi:nicotinamidase-related amidase
MAFLSKKKVANTLFADCKLCVVLILRISIRGIFMTAETITQLPIPSHFDARRVGEVWRVPYQQRAVQAKNWAKQHQLSPAAEDKTRICLLAIDVQNTFCIPDFELFVGGRSGMGAVEDNVRLCEFIYRNLSVITEVTLTMDTHTAMQIFHPVFWINDAGEHPEPMTTISFTDVQQGKWKVNPAIAYSLAQGNYTQLQSFALHYTKRLSEDGKYPLTIWPYHAMLGGIGHALVSAVEEACFFHAIARNSQTNFEIKGNNPLTENYSVLRPEVLQDDRGQPIAQKNSRLLEKLWTFDAVIIAGQAKSHCVAWTVDDLLAEIQTQDPKLAQKVYLLEDCCSPVVVPGVVDYTDQANAAFQRFADAGMHVVKSTEAIASWIDINL